MTWAYAQLCIPRVLVRAAVHATRQVPILPNHRVSVLFLVTYPCGHTPCTCLVYLCSLQEPIGLRLIFFWVGLTVLSCSTSLLFLTSGRQDFTLDKDLTELVAAQDTLLEQCRQRGYVLTD